jgi:hypothetical protein
MGVAQDAPSRGYVSSPGALVSLAALMVRVPADFPMMLPSMALLHPNRLLSITGHFTRNPNTQPRRRLRVSWRFIDPRLLAAVGAMVGGGQGERGSDGSYRDRLRAGVERAGGRRAVIWLFLKLWPQGLALAIGQHSYFRP